MKISVVTSSYNRMALLQQTIESVQRSKFMPLMDVTFEHIIYDDGSEDGTASMLDAVSYDNVIHARGLTNKGQSAARNKALERTSGDYIFMVDSDDIVLERTLYHFTRLALQQPQVAWFTADFLRVDEDLRYLPGQDYFGWQFASCTQMLQAIFKGEHFIESNTFFKREIFFEVGGFDEDLHMSEDLDLYIRFVLAGYLPVYKGFVSHLHRVHPGNITNGVTLLDHLVNIEGLRRKYQRELRYSL
ncbi:glycosyltransferase family 2 protein [Pseudomonas putida]